MLTTLQEFFKKRERKTGKFYFRCRQSWLPKTTQNKTTS